MIKVLPLELSNQIAAGEVVERPASVVKELVENSIDAGATRIQIEIEESGKKLIRVIDNGCGMGPENSRLAFERHATSKITKQEDLSRICTLGFRGEALPSIASVARVRLRSFNSSSSAGTEIRIEGGGEPKIREVGCPQGTTIEVEDIFYNTPARKKFLKANSTESAQITQVVQQQALAHPQIQFLLIHNRRKVIDTLPNEHVLYRIAELFGPELAKELIVVNRADGKYKIYGFVSSPVFTYNNRKNQFCFVNTRHVKDDALQWAVRWGYSHLLPKGQHPALFLFLEMDPELLDVNVHPAKAEVRFAFKKEVQQFVAEAIQESLHLNEKSFPENSKKNIEEVEFPKNDEILNHASKFNLTESKQQSRIPFTKEYPNISKPNHSNIPINQAVESLLGGARQLSNESTLDCPSNLQIEFFDQKPKTISDLIFSEFEPIGQLNQSFIIMQGPRGLLVVDQHIAHERVLYERFRESAENKSLEIQTLLFPVTVDLSPVETDVLNHHLKLVQSLGIEIEPFGNKSFLLRAVPAILKKHDPIHLLRDIIESLSREDPEVTLKEKYEEIVIMMACRNAIMVNHPMGIDQIKKLISDLEQTQMPFTCPHGRPIALLFDINDILRKFQRK